MMLINVLIFSNVILFRLLCALEGTYLVQEATLELMDEEDSLEEQDELQCVKFSCSIPRVTGRGFIEVSFL